MLFLLVVGVDPTHFTQILPNTTLPSYQFFFNIANLKIISLILGSVVQGLSIMYRYRCSLNKCVILVWCPLWHKGPLSYSCVWPCLHLLFGLIH